MTSGKGNYKPLIVLRLCSLYAHQPPDQNTKFLFAALAPRPPPPISPIGGRMMGRGLHIVLRPNESVCCFVVHWRMARIERTGFPRPLVAHLWFWGPARLPPQQSPYRL